MSATYQCCCRIGSRKRSPRSRESTGARRRACKYDYLHATSTSSATTTRKGARDRRTVPQYPVARWRTMFGDVLGQLTKRVARRRVVVDDRDREQRQGALGARNRRSRSISTAGASSSPTTMSRVARSATTRWTSSSCSPTNPFVQQDSRAFAFIRPPHGHDRAASGSTRARVRSARRTADVERAGRGARRRLGAAQAVLAGLAARAVAAELRPTRGHAVVDRQAAVKGLRQGLRQAVRRWRALPQGRLHRSARSFRLCLALGFGTRGRDALAIPVEETDGAASAKSTRPRSEFRIFRGSR